MQSPNTPHRGKIISPNEGDLGVLFSIKRGDLPSFVPVIPSYPGSQKNRGHDLSPVEGAPHLPARHLQILILLRNP